MLRKNIIKTWRFIKKIEKKNGVNSAPLLYFLSKYGIEPILDLFLKIRQINLPSGSSWESKLKFLLKWSESESVRVCKKVIHPGMNVLDIGANVGYFTLLFSELVGPENKVFAFEPHPETYRLLVKNIHSSKYKNIIPVRKALSDKEGEVEFFEVKDISKSSFYDVSKYLSKVDPRGYAFKKRLTVDTITLDDFLGKIGDPEINFIKMDIEGAEPKALAGMKKTIERSKDLKMIVEFNAGTLQVGGVSSSEFLNQLIEMGFEIKAVLDAGGRIQSINQLKNSQAEDGYVNLFCVRNND